MRRNIIVLCCALVATAVVAGEVEACIGPPPWEIPAEENYFPLHVGNSWTYSDGVEEWTFSITGTQQHDGHTYYVFNDYFAVGGSYIEPETEGGEVLFRYDPIANKLLKYDAGQVSVRYDFSEPVSTLWEDPPAARWRQSGVTVNVPAGEFTDSLNAQFGPTWGGPDAWMWGEYLAPDVGNVRHTVPGGVTGSAVEGERGDFQLQSYTVLGPTTTILHDMDGSGGATEPNGNDINPFVLGLVDRPAYIAQYGRGPDIVGDSNGDGLFNGNDINGFVGLLTRCAASQAEQSIPEPASALLLLMGLAGLVRRHRKR